MSLRADSTYRCDRCGCDVGNGGVSSAAIVSDLDPSAPGAIRVLHLCRTARPNAPTGCVGAVLDATNVADWTTYREGRP